MQLIILQLLWSLLGFFLNWPHTKNLLPLENPQIKLSIHHSMKLPFLLKFLSNLVNIFLFLRIMLKEKIVLDHHQAIILLEFKLYFQQWKILLDKTRNIIPHFHYRLCECTHAYFPIH